MHTPDSQRLHSLDAVRGFALLLGVAFHAALSFMPDWPPGIWAMVDNSPSPVLSDAAFVAHLFRMTLFFFIAGFFARLLHQKRGTGGFWKNRLLRIGVPLIVGWAVLYPIIAAVWTAGLTKIFGGNLPPMPEMPKSLGAFPVTHLWFLYQLMQLYVITLLVRSLIARIDTAQKFRCVVDAMVASALRIPLLVFLLAIPVALALMTLPMWFYWAGIPTPDMTLIPQLAPVVGYGVAFAFGWLVHRSATALTSIAKYWWLNLAVGASAAAWLLLSLHASPMAPPGFPADPLLIATGGLLTKSGFALMFGVAAWGISLGLTGAALRFLSAFSPVRRYIADASYWIYLAHLPVVAALQVWVGHWQMSWMIKFPLILVISFAILFASYHWLVRSTPIGLLLNGRMYRRGTPGVSPPASPAPGSPAPRGGSSGEGTVAELRGVTKKFGAQVALDAIDIEVRSGELLAVLGPNGAGKSTAISLWLGLIEADGGEVRLLGGAPQEILRRQGLGVMMQDVEMPKELRVRELVSLASSYYSDPLPIEETLRRAGVNAFADKAYGKLSGGQKRLAQFAVAICGQPRVLFLDEPSVGLDVQAREALWRNVRSLLSAGCSIVLTTHYLEEAEALADRVAVINKGRLIACGSVADMRALVARRQIRCESRLPVEEVRGWPGVLDAQTDRDRLVITAIDAEGVVRRLLGADATLTHLEVRQAGLNEAFNELTKEAA